MAEFKLPQTLSSLAGPLTAMTDVQEANTVIQVLTLDCEIALMS